MHIFTYGTLMFPQVWQAVVGRTFETVEGTIGGFAVHRIRDAVFPGMTAAADSSLARGVVYLNVDPETIERLDRFEDGFYERLTIGIDCADGERRLADAYVVPSVHRHVLANELWERDSFLTSGGLEQFIGGFAGFGRVAEGA